MLTFGVVVLGVTDRQRAEDFWCAALGYQVREEPFGGWARVLAPPAGQAGAMIALQTSRTPAADYPRLHFDLHVTGTDEQEAEARRLVCLGGRLAARGPAFHRLARPVHVRRLVPRGLPSVDRDHGPGDERGLLRAQPEHHLRHLGRAAGPPHRR